ncbi:DUF6549 family protein [Dysgonomonas sp. 520]|uniref:DUF6549 family protein n=1 Tax=Dysgonomonas sp. 520 TaxID=2302931 RepID=UPI0013D80B36|nr:DUF6549 family protein [Dysgonomonas sp. 520]NDW09933.1 hypothetical protein [Dysgonomonas sp. 520]
MKSKLISIMLLAVLLLGTAVFVLYRQYKQLLQERDKYKSNTTALLSDIKRMQVDSTTTAIDVKQLRLTLDEYKQYRAEDAEKIKKLGVKLKDLQAVAKHRVEVNAPIQAGLKDSVIIRDTLVISVKTLAVQTPHIQINGVIENDSLHGSIHLPVNLHQAVWVEPKHKFLWWRWGVKAIHQTISNDNPYVEIKYSEMIKLEK